MIMKQHSYAFYNGYCKSEFVGFMATASLDIAYTSHSVRSLPAPTIARKKTQAA